MSAAEDKAVVNRLMEVWSQGNLAVVDEICSADFVRHGPVSEGEVRGPEGFKQLITRLRELIPDLQVVVDDQLAEDGRVATRWTARGARQGRPAVVTGILVNRVANGKVAEEWAAYDAGEMFKQIGLA
jgi:predicted ester cyclase